MGHEDEFRLGAIADIDFDKPTFPHRWSGYEGRQQGDTKSGNRGIVEDIAVVDTQCQLRTDDDCAVRSLETPVRNAAIGVKKCRDDLRDRRATRVCRGG